MSDDPQGDNRSTDEIEADLAATREHLADTVDALQHRLDVKTRASEKVADVRREHGRTIIVAGAVAAGLVVVLAVVRRRRR